MENKNLEEKAEQPKVKYKKSAFTTKQIVLGAIFLAVCIASQFLKNISPFITGSIINTMLLCTAFFVGIRVGAIIAIITPVTSFFISGSPAFPVLLPGIMAGNLVLVLVAGLLGYKRPGKARLAISLIAGVISKFLLMWALFTYYLIPLVANGISAKQADAIVPKLTFNFTILQLITATIAAIIVFSIYYVVEEISKRHKNPALDKVEKDADSKED